MPIERKLAAIMFTDIVAFSKMMGNDEELTLTLLEKHDEICMELFTKYNGELIKKLGDGNLVKFDSSLEAVKCAIALQSYYNDNNEVELLSEKIKLRVGIHIGDVIRKDGDIFSDSVNATSRITAFANEGGICISPEAYRAIQGQKDIHVASIGEYHLKNIVGKWNLHRVFSNKKDFQEWSEKTYSAKKEQERKSKLYKIALTISVVSFLLFINIPLIINKFVQYQNNIKLENLYTELESTILFNNNIRLTKNAEGVILSHKGNYGFNAGSVELKLDVMKLLDKYIPLINSFDGYMDINTHSDNDKMPAVIKRKMQYSTNYQLSSSRSAAIFAYLIKGGLDFTSGRIRASFWGERIPYKFNYLGKMATDEEIELANSTVKQKANNRRIDFHFYYK